MPMSKQQMLKDMKTEGKTFHSVFHTPFANMERSIQNILDVYYDEAEKDFLKNYDVKGDFMEQFFAHTIYDLVVLINHGDDDSVLAWVETFREENAMVSDCEETDDEEDDKCMKCSGCRENYACDQLVEKSNDFPEGSLEVNFYCPECIKLIKERNLYLWE